MRRKCARRAWLPKLTGWLAKRGVHNELRIALMVCRVVEIEQMVEIVYCNRARVHVEDSRVFRERPNLEASPDVSPGGGRRDPRGMFVNHLHVQGAERTLNEERELCLAKKDRYNVGHPRVHLAQALAQRKGVRELGMVMVSSERCDDGVPRVLRVREHAHLARVNGAVAHHKLKTLERILEGVRLHRPLLLLQSPGSLFLRPHLLHALCVTIDNHC
mmetsp:Transcript_1710/g.6084  ORF Transcript_1710/g.6084 Transcript_1710/m.6084 type:complete len:217 (+) Transcript_1710:379-1029(+)